MDGLGHELLAAAGLAAHEHRGARGRDLLHEAQDLLDGGALPDDLAVRLDHPDLGLEVVAFRLEPVLQFLDLGVRLPQRLLALPSLRDVAEDAVRLPHAAFGVALGDAGHVMHPPLPASRVDEAILDGDLLQPSVVKPLALLQEVRTVVGMHSLQEELHGQKALLPFRGKAEEIVEPGVEEGDAFAVIHLVEPEAGEVGGRLQASLTRAKRLLGSLPLGDVDGEAHQAVWLAGGRPVETRTGVDPAHASIAREDDPVLRSDGFLRPRGLREGSPDEVPVVWMHRSLETLHADDLGRLVPEDRPSPVGDPEDACAVIQSPEPRLGGVCRQAQALLALSHAQLVAPADERVGEDLCHQLQALHQGVWPVARLPQGIEAQGAHGRLAPHREWEDQG